MTHLSRRRFLTISAGAGAWGLAGLGGFRARAADLYHWRGIALGAQASITLAHPRAERIVASCRREIERLETVFSLYRPDSALSRLNAEGSLAAPPPELLECLGLSGAVHAATGGLFDPTIQPLWRLYAEHHAHRGRGPDPASIEETLTRVGWDGVVFVSDGIRFSRPGMALSLNGIAQGYIADRVAALLRAEGLDEVLVNTGELRALGGHPHGGGWPVELDTGSGRARPSVSLRDQALASSAPAGTAFDAAGTVGHILHPATGRPAPATWRLVSILAPRAALADALSTAMCLMTREEIARTLAVFPSASLAYLG